MITLITMTREKTVRKRKTKTTKNEYRDDIFQHTCADINFHLEILMQKCDWQIFFVGFNFHENLPRHSEAVKKRFLVGICRPLFPTLLKGLHLLRPERQNRFATSYFLLLLKNSFMNLIFFLLFLKFIMQKDIEKCCSHKHSVVVWRFPPLYLQKQTLMFPISLPRLYISCLYFYISCQATTVMKLFHNQLIYHNQVKKVSSQPQCGSV